jgi:hypothetical protein
MKRNKQWEKPEIGLVSRSKSKKIAESFRVREDIYSGPPSPPAPYSTTEFRAREDCYSGPPSPPSPGYLVGEFRVREDIYSGPPSPPDYMGEYRVREDCYSGPPSPPFAYAIKEC